MDASIFNVLRDVLFTKKGNYAELAADQLDLQPFMLQRWCSMSDKNATLIINETSNRWLATLQCKSHIYKLYFAVLPKQRQKKIAYIKKAAKSSIDTNDIESICNSQELSSREIKEYKKTLCILNYE